jgi:peptidoglycan/xylan/chitin deacetylase (PgdA/CDA1 family)
VRFYKTPWLVQALLPSLKWRQLGTNRSIYLTFDDGPIPEITPFVLTELTKYNAKATFFCVGDNIRKHPHIAQEVVAAGHRLGNHTYHHLQGWQTPTLVYLENIQACDTELYKISGHNNVLFRPPYGRINRAQYLDLKSEYQIIMWDVLTYDFDVDLSPEKCLTQAIKNTRPGSIVVFHDSVKASRNLKYVLPRYLAHFAQQNFRFEAL